MMNAANRKMLLSILFNIYTSDQPIRDGIRSFIYAEDLCITAQYQSIKKVEETIKDALDKSDQENASCQCSACHWHSEGNQM